jgi:hypothetical protein
VSTPSLALKQGVFDIVVQHAAGMQRQSRSADAGLCMYRDGKGGACFAGALMSDEHVAAMPHRMMYADLSELSQQSLLPDHMIPHRAMIRRLQRIHDCPSNWLENGMGPPNKPVMAAALRDLAEDYGLKTELVDTHFAS